MSKQKETRAAFARRLGVNRGTVTRWGQAGRLVFSIDNKVLIAESIARLDATKGARSDVSDRHAQQRGKSIPAPDTTPQESEPSSPIDGSGDQRAEFKRRTIQAQTQAAKIEIALEEGLRLPLDLLRNESQAIGGGIRQAIERLVDEAAPRIAATNCHTDRRQIIGDAVRDAKRSIIAEIRAASRRARNHREDA